MQSIDMEYFSEYKTVERICRDMYGEDGVKAYIDEMEKCTNREKMFVSNWDNKIKTLKHLKWLRNQIAHDNEAYEVTEQDLADIKAFYTELLTQQDPLALLYKEIENTKKNQQEFKLQQRSMQRTRQQQIQHTSQSQQDDESNNSKTWAIVAAVTVVAVIAVIVFFFL